MPTQRTIPDASDPCGLDVLLVEDDADTRVNLARILELDSHRAQVAGTLKEALRSLSLTDFACILLDRRLPDGTADDVLPELRRLAPKAAVIVVTGNANMEATIAALRHGVTDFLVKPIDPDVIRSTLSRIARLREAEERTLRAERLANIGQVVTSLAHESRNYLQRICNSIDLLEEIDKDNPKALEEIARIHSAENGLEHLLEDVREYAAPMHLEQADHSIQSVWRMAWSDVTSAKDVSGVFINESGGDNDRHTCHVDAFRVGQVFRNLFENSLAACGDGACVDVHCDDHADGVLKIVVRDNGPGLEAEQQTKVFEPFFTTKSKGTGLGMAIAKRIVEAHGGDICVGSGSTDGAEFIISLPVRDG